MKIAFSGLFLVCVSVFVYLQLRTSTAIETALLQTNTPPVQNIESVPTEIVQGKVVSKSEMIKERGKILPITAPSLRDLSASVVPAQSYHDFVNPSAYIHTDKQPITISEHIGKKIILLSFMTYSCINCKRTFPTLVHLDEEYRDDGLLIIGIHTPEFAFEHDANRVEEELAKYGITFPIVLDNKYETWNAYKNRFWPRRYIIDTTGNIVYDHIGEGDYEGTERVIKALLPTLPTV